MSNTKHLREAIERLSDMVIQLLIQVRDLEAEQAADRVEAYNEEEVREVLIERVKGSTVRKVAGEIGFSPGYISDLCLQRRKIGTSVASKLGYVLVQPKPYYRKEN